MQDKPKSSRITASSKQLTWFSLDTIIETKKEVIEPERINHATETAGIIQKEIEPIIVQSSGSTSTVQIMRSPEYVKKAEPKQEIIEIKAEEKTCADFYGLPAIDYFKEFNELEGARARSDLFTTTIYKLPEIQFDIKGNPNEELWNRVLDTSETDMFTIRDFVYHNYKSLGQTAVIEGDRGLADMARRREANFAQFFTLPEIVSFISNALYLNATWKNPIVVDNSCGIGGMFRYLSPTCYKTGVEIEEQAFQMASRLWPDAKIVNDSLINHPDIQGDYFIINPPFSIQLEKRGMTLQNAKWGDLGPSSSIQSHIAALEIAIKNATRYVAAVLPMGYFTNENTYTFEKWVNSNAELIMRIDMPAEVWKDAGTAWPCSIVIYHTRFSHYNKKEPFIRTISRLSDLNTVLKEWVTTIGYYDAVEELLTIDDRLQIHVRPSKPQEIQKATIAPDLSISDKETGVKISLAPDASNLVIRPSNLLEALKLQQYLDGMGQQWNDGLKTYTKESNVRLRRKHILSNPQAIETIRLDLNKMGMNATVDKQVHNWITKKQRWAARQLVPFEQFIKKDGEWECLNEDKGIRKAYAGLYKARSKEFDKLKIGREPWPFQKDDIVRMSLKNSNLLCWSMGLGKASSIIILTQLYGCKHNLIIVEPKLIDEFEKELRNLDVTDYQVISSEKDLKHLKRINLIAYNKLWKPLNENTKKTFSKAMRRRFGFIAVDEAHKIKAKDSQQALAVRTLKARYKLLSTGTPIANYPRNIFSLLVWGWGDATELNPYGYYGPIEQTNDRGYTSGYTTGTRQFKEDFISIEWVTPQFEQTLDKGMKAREMPKIKDTEKWWKMMSPKIIRRQREEPEVAPSVTIPKPEISTELIKMDAKQTAFYKHWLDEFAAWFKAQLELEGKTEGGHKIDQMVVLAHLTQLQFASTIPQSPKTNNTHCTWPGGLTTKELRTIELIKEALSNEEKVIVFSERPEFQKLMQRELQQRGIKSHVFIGSQGIKSRNVSLNDFKSNGIHVLLATTTCGETGLNIPEANVVIIADTSWTPSKQIQAYSRILRPQQKRIPRIYLLRSEGTIDEYMQQLMSAKSEAIDEGIDYIEASKFDPDKWLSYRDFTLRMLEKQGYNMR